MYKAVPFKLQLRLHFEDVAVKNSATLLFGGQKRNCPRGGHNIACLAAICDVELQLKFKTHQLGANPQPLSK